MTKASSGKVAPMNRTDMSGKNASSEVVVVLVTRTRLVHPMGKPGVDNQIVIRANKDCHH